MRVTVVIAALVGVRAGCAPGPRRMRWSIEFASPALRDRTELVVARVRAGSCEGGVIHEVRQARGTMGSTASAVLGPGSYGLEAFALDEDCAWVASDCRAVGLPSDVETTLVLGDGSFAPDCPPSLCGARRCAPIDGGSDASFDAGPRDAAGDASDAPELDAPDAGSDAARCAPTTPTVT